jgi:hypothetical protein
MIDIYSRMIVGTHVYYATAALAVNLMTEVFGVQGVPRVVHADRGNVDDEANPSRPCSMTCRSPGLIRGPRFPTTTRTPKRGTRR